MAYFNATRAFKQVPIAAAQGFGLKARYTPVENVPTLYDARCITDRYSPKRAAVIDHYSRLAPGRLSWRVISNISAKKIGHAVLRNRLKRRWASAFAEALKDHGYYHNGRRRTGPKEGKNCITGLKGTLEILIFSDRGVSGDHRELVGASRALVKSLTRKVQRLEVEGDANADKGAAEEEETRREFGPDAEGSSSLWSLWRKLR